MGVVEGDDPDAEGLGYVGVEEEGGFVECWGFVRGVCLVLFFFFFSFCPVQIKSSQINQMLSRTKAWPYIQ